MHKLSDNRVVQKEKNVFCILREYFLKFSLLRDMVVVVVQLTLKLFNN